MFYIRKAIQLISLITFFTLICYTTYPLSLGKFVTIFPQLSPFLLTTGLFLIPGIITIGLTLILGRVFCGWICPLGCLLEYLHILFPKRIPRAWQGIKYYLPLGFIIGLPFLWYIEPLCLMQRVFCFMLSLQSYTPYFIFTLVTFILILFFRRKWCQSLCPLGGLLSMLSRYKQINRLVLPACNQCKRCSQACWMNLKQNDCLLCFRCKRSCPKEAVSFCFGKPAIEKIDVSRRGILLAMGAGIIAAFSTRLVPCIQDKYLIRPPGALPEDRFRYFCIKCGACIKVCPSHGLVPDFFGSGLIGLGSPRLMPRIGACEDYCNLCGQVCPSGAIQKLGEDEKRKKKIGTAVIDTDRCLAYARNRKLCLICDEQCLNNAIDMDEKKRPVVDKKKCIGCGVCENNCPIGGNAAIRVERGRR
ncbi:4Fe-4S binding protein [Candidatus Desantisbacteria bacterium]|nr:4Fe-4S binding protein [Candidatus Desantisbacteria bacterium]